MRGNDRGRPGEERPQSVTDGDKPRVTDTHADREAQTITYLERFGRRVLLDALSEATADYWRRRAVALRDARHRVGDYLPPDRLQAARAKWRELTAAADACDNAASFLEAYGNEIFAADVASVMTEGAAA
jgi:hypothetical protein